MRRRRPYKTVARANAGNAAAAPASQPAAQQREQPPLTIALIDPKPLTREAIIDMLGKAFPDRATIAASNCEELIGTRETPYIVIVNINGSSVADGWVQNELQLARSRLPDALIVIISDREDPDEVLVALSCGALGYLPTSIASTVAFAAINLIQAGGTYIPPCALRPPTVDPESKSEDEPGEPPDELDFLTVRELAVIRLLCDGKPNKLIATHLNMQESTVKVHVRNILKKLHAGNRTQAASVANRLFARQPVRNGAGPIGERSAAN